MRCKLSLLVKLSVRKSSPIWSGSPAIPWNNTVLSEVTVKAGQVDKGKIRRQLRPFESDGGIELRELGIGIRQS